LLPHEIFAFAPYWTLDQSAAFDVQGMTTIAYFSIGVNPDGTLDESDSGWAGYQSQAFADLVNRAHAAGDRVVLTVNCFDQSALDQLTSSPTAPGTLASALVAAVASKNLDGVNLDFEGNGSADQAGLTALVTYVSAALKAANPHYQVTMDTYASSAGDPNGFYNIKALAPAVDAFFVMAYQLNLEGSPSQASPLTSGMFSDLSTVAQYIDAVAPSKVILGVPFYGYDWPTTDGTLLAQETGGPSPVAYAQIVAAAHPAYWDPVTDTAWTSYQVGAQWHETFFEDPSSLYMEAQLAQFFHIAGLGIWALGFDRNDPQMLGALLGFAPAAKTGLAGPAITSTSPTSTTPPTSTSTSAAAQPAGPSDSAPLGAPVNGSSTTGLSSTTSTTSTTTTTTSGPPGGPTFSYSGLWNGTRVPLTPVTAPATSGGSPTLLGELTGFQTDDPADACLQTEKELGVWTGPASGVDEVVTQTPFDCVTASFTFTVPAGTGGGSGGSGGTGATGSGASGSAGSTGNVGTATSAKVATSRG